MTELMFLLLFIFALFLITIGIFFQNNGFWRIVSTVLTIPIFFTLSLTTLRFHRPYELYNGTGIETGIHEYSVVSDVLISYLFQGLSLIMIFYLIITVFDEYKRFKGR